MSLVPFRFPSTAGTTDFFEIAEPVFDRRAPSVAPGG